jgi:cysteine synthase
MRAPISSLIRIISGSSGQRTPSLSRGSHQMPGIGMGFVPQVLNRSIVDEVIAVSDEEAFACARRLAREEWILAGVSSGAALHAALTALTPYNLFVIQS